jgi:acetyl-CoA synthetase
MKPGSATLPFFGIDLAILDPTTGKELMGNDVTGVLAIRKPWPSIARTVYNNHKRYLDTYMNPYSSFYFTGDGARYSSFYNFSVVIKMDLFGFEDV